MLYCGMTRLRNTILNYCGLCRYVKAIKSKKVVVALRIISNFKISMFNKLFYSDMAKRGHK